MSRRLAAAWVTLLLLFVSKAWALGLGDIRLESALGEPLRAEIEIISASPGELEALFVQLATPETFARYGLDRPRFLSDIRFDVESRNGRNFVTVTTASPVVEPFVTILIEASWPQGRILREYTMLIDPPTFTPPAAVKAAPQVTAPAQTREADRGVIERPAPRETTQAPRETAAPAPQPRPEEPRAAAPAGEQVYRVAPSETLWGIARDMRPDEGLSINQTMLAIFEANPQAFNGNINRLRAGAYLTIPTADDIYRISRGDATAEVKRQNEEWSGAPAPAPVAKRPSLSLVPPDEEVSDTDRAAYDDYTPAVAAVPDTELQDRVRDLEDQIADKDALIEVRDNEIARLQEQLEQLQSEQEAAADGEAPAEGAAGVDLEGKPEPQPAPAQPRPAEEPGLFGTILDFLTGFWGAVIGGLVILALVMVWFARRAVMTAGADDAYADAGAEALAPLGDTTKIEPIREDEDAFVVVEGERDEVWTEDGADTMEVPTAKLAQTTRFEPGETFSTETGVNLDAEDPIAEADFHLAYGLYDQAAELISNALAKDEDSKDLLAKLCEIYFVWGNKDEFVKAAERLHGSMGDHLGAEWDKVAIMGQQIAPDSELFSVGASLASSAVDLAFDEEADSALDIDLEGDSGDGDTQIMDLGESGDDVDFIFDEADEESAAEDETVESPATEQTEHMKVLQPSTSAEDMAADFHRTDDTAEIDLDDLGLDLEGLAESGIREGIGEEDVDLDLGDVDDQMAKTDFQIGKLEDVEAESAADEDTKADFLDMDLSSGEDAANESDGSDAEDSDIEITGVNEALLIDDDETAADVDDDDSDEVFDIGEDFDDESDAETEVLQEGDETEVLPEDLGVALDSSLLDPTGETAVIDEDKLDEIGEDEPTVLTDLSAVPDADETRQLPVAEADDDLSADDLDDLDLDLDDLTAALKVGDIAEDLDDLTTEQPAIDADKLAAGGDETLDLDVGSIFDDEELTEALPPEKLGDASTMTEVGTKLDLARAYIDMGDPAGARSILEEVIAEGDESHKQQAQQLLDSLPG